VDTADLIRRAHAGDQDALGQLLAGQRDQLIRQAEQSLDPRVKARIDASDVVQQTCLSAFQQFGEFYGRDPAQFAAWLRQIHDRNIQNAVRHHQANMRAAGRDEPFDCCELGTSGQTTPSQHAIQREDAARLDDALSHLPVGQRTVLRLRYLEGCTLDEVAEQLGLTRDAVVWQMQQGMKHVRTLLNESAGLRSP